MDIKEIALRIGEKADEYADALPKWYGGKIKWIGGDYSIDETNEIIDAARGES